MRYVISAVIWAFLICNAGNSLAAPQTVKFDAQVTQVFRGDLAPSLPFEIEAGSLIQGKFTFEPAPVGKVGTQSTGISFGVGGTDLQSSTFGIMPELGFYSPIILTNDVSFQPIDLSEPRGSGIRLDCWSIGTQCSPGTVPNTQMTWEFHLAFESLTQKLINEFKVPSDLDIWNGFDRRSLEFIFYSGFPGTGVIVEAGR